MLGGQKRKLSAEAKSGQSDGNGRSSAKKSKVSGRKANAASNKSKFQGLLGESTTHESDLK